ncbi:MAG: cyanobactin biosynthesis PatC/TenC/TruC family protein [Desmonostoc vinosum HA7617-LM4]|jgi:cyanobactin cluster PatC/TenC/TruC protein|nr:cyanobactin biosynthesis PatC/TenC/TruC family protein [Desmonostoc vinosum HA7617-LM4]
MTEQTKSLHSVLVFDGQDDSINLGKKPEFKIEKEIALEAWVYCQTQRRRTGIISNVFDTTTKESGYGLLLDGKSGVFFALKTGSQGIHYLSSKVDSLKLNQWHHLAGTYDGQQIKVYIDGVEKATKATSNSPINYEPENDLFIGTYKDNNETYPFQGKIAEVRIWKVARTQQEIQKHIYQRLGGKESGLVGYWPLNEGSNNIARDRTTNANHGTITGATWEQSSVPFTIPQSQELAVAKTTAKEKETTSESNKTEQQTPENAKKVEEIDKHLLATGLEDYGFWWQEMLKAQANKTELDKPFRRGRIWS